MEDFQRKLTIPVSKGDLDGELVLPPRAKGLVVLAHASGSSRHSPRNQQLAASLRHAGLATLLIDLLTPEEDELDTRWGELRFDIQLLGRRLTRIIDWLGEEPLPLGCFGASTGAAAALVAAANRRDRVQSVVSRGGRPDLAGAHLYDVHAPTLFIVGGDDEVVLDLNRASIERMRCERRLSIIPGATHFFEEPGALDQVGQLAAQWFVEHLAGRPHPAHP